MSRHSSRTATEPDRQTSAAVTPPRSWKAGGWVLPLVLGLCVVLTAVSGLVIGWLAVAFQLFGDTADAEDYRVAAGAYAASALVLMLGAVAVRGLGAPRWQLVWALCWAGVLVILALSAVSEAAASTDPGPGISTWTDGAGGALACPWTWPLVLLGAAAPFGRGSRVSG